MKHFGFTLVELLVVIAIIAIIIGFLSFGWILQVPFFAVFGWIWGLCRFVAGLFHEPFAILIGSVAILLLPFSLHFFLAPILKRHELRWSLRRSVYVSTMLVLIAAAGIATLAGIHDVLWLFGSKEPLIKRVGGMGAARRMQSSNNLKQWSIAAHNFHDVHEHLPSGGTVLPNGRLGHGWMTQLLPYNEQQETYEKVDFAKPWNDPANADIFKKQPGYGFCSPHFKEFPVKEQTDRNGFANTDYAANELVLPVGRSFTFKEITDGTSNTLLFGEVKTHCQPWGSPLNGRDPRLGVNKSPYGFGSKHAGGMNFSYCDGSVRFISNTTDQKILDALATPNGGEESPQL